MTVATVLRSGGNVYGPEWVYALRVGVRKWLPDARFVCLTDVDIPGIDTVELIHDWPGWWSKVELFRPGVFDGPALYMDLDTLPVGDLSEIASYQGGLAVLSDLYRPKNTASGVMAWAPGEHTGRIYRTFRENPGRIMENHRARSDYWYRKVWGEPDRLQNLCPGQIVSLKADAKEAPPKDARLVCGHGRPRLSSPKAGWAHDMWRKRTERGQKIAA